MDKYLFRRLASLAHGRFPYQLFCEIDGKELNFSFRFQWFSNLMWAWAVSSKNIQADEQGIVYSNKVWRAWKLQHNILYRLHYRYDRPYGVCIHAKIQKRWTMKLKHKNKVSYV